VIVCAFQSSPYAMDPYGNGTIVGYGVDLLELLAQTLEFQYDIFIVSDNNYGVPDNRTGQWDGMIGEILSGVSYSYINPCIAG